MTSEATVHVVDDDAPVRDALRSLLEAEGFLVRIYADADAFLAAAPSHRPACVLLDIRMPGMDGLTLHRQLGQQAAPLPCIFITGHADIPLAVRALKQGAFDFIEKPFSDDVLLNAVGAAIQADAATYREGQSKAELARRIARLSERETEVLRQIVDGRSSKEIARHLDLSPRTVESHRVRIMDKMQAENLSELVRFSLGGGLIES